MSALTIGSLFSGIGGLELGLEWAGLGPTLWQVERDEYCRGVLARHWPHATRYEDVQHVGGTNLAPVDVICGGFPCQDVSNAGRRAGVVAGTRSGLWFEYARIVRELRPRYVVVENVAALLTLGLDAVLGELAALGYDAEWDCVPASAIGAPHERDRVLVVAYTEHHRISERRGTSVAGVARGLARGVRRDESPCSTQQAGTMVGDAGAHPSSAGRKERNVAAVAEGTRLDSRRAVARGNPWEAEPRLVRVADGVPHRVQRLRALGNAVVPQVAEVVGRLIVERERALQERAA